MRRAAPAIALCGLLLGCGAASDTHTEERALLPATDRDPEPWTPAPTDEATAGGEITLALGGSTTTARLLALRLVSAIRDGDESALGAMLAPQLARAQPRPTPVMLERAALIEVLLRSPRRSDLASDAALDELVAVDRIEIRSLAEVTQEVPRGLRPTDLVVTLPFSQQGQRLFRPIVPGWTMRAMVIVRNDGTPLVVAL